MRLQWTHDNNKKHTDVPLIKMYSTNINVIGSIPDIDMIINIISNYAHGGKSKHIKDIFFNQNIYDIRTRKSRSRFLRAINGVFLQFKSSDHQTVVYSLFSKPNLSSLKKTALFFQLAINDKLFYELSKNVFLELYFAGRLSVDKSEFTSYIYDLRDKNTDIENWSDSTIKIVASKYLTLLKKLDLVKGTLKKEFKHIIPEDKTIVYVIYLVHSLGDKNFDILKNPYIPFLMLRQQNLIERLKKIALSDFFEISTLGYDLKIDLKYSYEEIVNVIAERY